MKKTILLTIALIILSTQVFAGILIDNTSDIIPKKIICDNGQKLKYYETRVLVSNQIHASGLPEKNTDVNKLILKEKKKVCDCNCNTGSIDEDIIVTYSWSY